MGGEGSGRKPELKRLVQERLEELDARLPDIFDWLEGLAEGPPIVCPECGTVLKERRVDAETCKYLIDRRLGKPSSKLEVTIEERFVLTADQCAAILQVGRDAQARFNALPAPSTALMVVEQGGAK